MGEVLIVAILPESLAQLVQLGEQVQTDVHVHQQVVEPLGQLGEGGSGRVHDETKHGVFTQTISPQNLRVVFLQWYRFSTSMSQQRTASGRKGKGQRGEWNCCRKLATLSPKSFARGIKSGSALILPIILRKEMHSKIFPFVRR